MRTWNLEQYLYIFLKNVKICWIFSLIFVKHWFYISCSTAKNIFYVFTLGFLIFVFTILFKWMHKSFLSRYLYTQGFLWIISRKNVYFYHFSKLVIRKCLESDYDKFLSYFIIDNIYSYNYFTRFVADRSHFNHFPEIFFKELSKRLQQNTSLSWIPIRLFAKCFITWFYRTLMHFSSEYLRSYLSTYPSFWWVLNCCLLFC